MMRISPEEALALIRDTPGEGRILSQAFCCNGLLFQFETGLQISWADGAFTTSVSERLRDDWAAWKAES